MANTIDRYLTKRYPCVFATEVTREREFKGALMVLMGKARVLRKQGTTKTRLLPFSESSGNLAGPKQIKI